MCRPGTLDFQNTATPLFGEGERLSHNSHTTVEGTAKRSACCGKHPAGRAWQGGPAPLHVNPSSATVSPGGMGNTHREATPLQTAALLLTLVHQNPTTNRSSSAGSTRATTTIIARTTAYCAAKWMAARFTVHVSASAGRMTALATPPPRSAGDPEEAQRPSMPGTGFPAVHSCVPRRMPIFDCFYGVLLLLLPLLGITVAFLPETKKKSAIGWLRIWNWLRRMNQADDY